MCLKCPLQGYNKFGRQVFGANGVDFGNRTRLRNGLCPRGFILRGRHQLSCGVAFFGLEQTCLNLC